MLNLEMSIKVNRINNNLQNAKISLYNAQKKLNNSITFDGVGFLDSEIKIIINQINYQKNNLHQKINLTQEE